MDMDFWAEAFKAMSWKERFQVFGLLLFALLCTGASIGGFLFLVFSLGS